MKKRALRWTLLLTLPVLLGVASTFAQQKQPLKPTARDLQQRAHLSKAVIVNMAVDGKYISIPSAEWKQALEDFYLVDPKGTIGPKPKKAIIVARLDKSESWPLCYIEVGLEQSYSGYNSRNLGASWVALHPVTERRLRELVAKHRPAK